MNLSRADMGTVWAVDPQTDSMTTVAQRGFGTEPLKDFARADSDGVGCRLAAIQGTQITIADVESDECFASYREVARAAGVRAVQSTAIVDSSSRVVGIVSTYYPLPHVPLELEGLIMRRFAELVTGALVRYEPAFA